MAADTNQTGTMPMSKPLVPTLSPGKKPPQKQKPLCPGRRILYMIQLNLTPDFLLEIKNSNTNLWRLLRVTKVGKSEDWGSFLVKIQRLQTYIPFATLRYVAILHDFNAFLAEQAMHFVFRQWHVEGEWYDLDDANRNRLQDRFSVYEKRRGTSHFPRQIRVIRTECQGHFYVASFDWDEAARDVINGIINNPALDLEWRFICQQMLCSKIGSTTDLNERGSNFIWVVCFANVKYFAIQHQTICAEEQRLHDSHFWSGAGEWYYVFYPEDEEDIIRQYKNNPPVYDRW
eukprot:CAMPEP_0172306498 /NCGR_PEP_ID=MMETSP1058-20130122/7552_1 /TAXON_ID=83371 /ORGANISM="Detonula confervacea, Strain CCMP 353" /LENGTH=287 /DNA_ID=CAMNT_0013018395 /DNA_START=93 /DNA_END=953 /DNA_ORIENTATION=-